jgi:hypothetical protein
MATYRIGAGLIANGRYDFREASRRVEERLRLMVRMTQAAKATGCNVLQLPAGLLTMKNRTKASQLAKELAVEMARTKLLVAFGIDVESESAKVATKAKMSNTAASLPFFGFIMENGSLLVDGARQTGIRTNEVTMEHVVSEAGHRVAPSCLLGGRKVSLLLCGEVRSETWRTHLQQQQPALVLHLAHASVVLGGSSKESWKPQVDDLLRRLPGSSAWVFTDHVKALSHWERSSSSGRAKLVDLVRQGAGRTASRVRNIGVDGGWLYTYDVDLN